MVSNSWLLIIVNPQFIKKGGVRLWSSHSVATLDSTGVLTMSDKQLSFPKGPVREILVLGC